MQVYFLNFFTLKFKTYMLKYHKLMHSLEDATTNKALYMRTFLILLLPLPLPLPLLLLLLLLFQFLLLLLLLGLNFT